MNEPYNLVEQQAALSVGQAMALQSFATACHIAGLNPVVQTEQLVELLRATSKRHAPAEVLEAIDAAYDRVLEDLKVNLVRSQLASKDVVSASAERGAR